MDLYSPFEEVFDPVLGKAVTSEELLKNSDIYKDRFIKAQKTYFEQLELQKTLEDGIETPAKPPLRGFFTFVPAEPFA